MAPGNDICRMDAVTIATKVKAKELSPVEVVDAVLARMDKLEPTLHAFCTPTPDLARETAKQIEQSLMAGNDVGPLAGVPIGIKDLVCTKGIRTASGSVAYKDFVPDEDDVVVERAVWLEACIVGQGVSLGQDVRVDGAVIGDEARVIRLNTPVVLPGTASAMNDDASPTTHLHGGHQAAHVGRRRGAFETVTGDHEGRFGGTVDPVQIDEVAVGVERERLILFEIVEDLQLVVSVHQFLGETDRAVIAQQNRVGFRLDQFGHAVGKGLRAGHGKSGNRHSAQKDLGLGMNPLG